MFQRFKSLKGRFRYDDSEMPFLQHLEEFRKTIIRSVLAILICMFACWPLVPWITEVLLEPAQAYIDSGQIVLQLPEVTSGFKMYLTLAFFGGVLISMPVLMFIIGSFIMPGIKDSERRIIQRIAGFAGVLFVVGVFMGYKWTLPLAMKIMWGFTGKLGGEAIWNYQKFIGFTLQILLGFGVAFQMPIIIILLGKLGLVNSMQLREKRRHVIVALFILAMLLTPPDPGTQILMAVPLILLYEFCIWFLYFSEGKESRSKLKRDESESEASQDTEPDKNETNEE